MQGYHESGCNSQHHHPSSDAEREFNAHVNITCCDDRSAHHWHQSSNRRAARGRLVIYSPILTTFENCTDFSAALWRSSMEKIFMPDSLI